MASPLPTASFPPTLLLGFEGILYSSVGPRGDCGEVKGTVQGRLSRATAPPTSEARRRRRRSPSASAASARPETPRGGGALLTPLLCTLCGALDSFLKLRGCPLGNPRLVPNPLGELAPQPP